jgi:acyl carrier protein
MRVEDQVLEIVRDNTEDSRQVTLASDLRKELCLDSFATLMVMNAIEEAFGVSIDQADFCQVKTVADVVALLRAKYQCA